MLEWFCVLCLSPQVFVSRLLVSSVWLVVVVHGPWFKPQALVLPAPKPQHFFIKSRLAFSFFVCETVSRVCVCVCVCIFLLPHSIKWTKCRSSEQIRETFHPLSAQLILFAFNEQFCNNTTFTETGEDRLFFSLWDKNKSVIFCWAERKSSLQLLRRTEAASGQLAVVEQMWMWCCPEDNWVRYSDYCAGTEWRILFCIFALSILK